MTTGLSITAGQCSERGIKPVNEDACGIFVPQPPLLTTKGIAVVIADGVSSSDAGREASEACVQGFLNDYFSTPESWTVKTSGRRVLGALNRWVFGLGQRSVHGSGQGMLTTLSVLIVKSATAHLFHVGDTRICRVRDGELECLTRDHQTWTISEKAFLSRAMGADSTVEIDYRGVPVEVGDIFLMTTDGVHQHITTKELTALLRQHRDNPEQGAREIVTRALEQGSQDNVTCQVVRIDQLPQQNEEEFYQQLSEFPFPPPLENGQVLDGYKILRELHASKRSQVYLALDSETNEKVVIKTPSINFADDPEYIDGFLQEEWVGRRIDNPHVLKVLEPKRRRRFLYYVTEHLEGQTLRQWMNDRPMADIADVRALVAQIVTGIRAFHRQEMIHQDLKPDNIMIDAHGTVKIVDFGSTKIAGNQEIATPIARGNLLGTLDYAAPEYFGGYAGTDRSDLYSIAAITYEMLTGQLPYGGPLSARTLKRVDYHEAKQHNPAVPAWIDGALAKALHKDPRRRHDALSEFIQDISRPNPALVKSDAVPLIERNPVAFWRGLSIILLFINVVLLYWLAKP